MNKEAYPWIGIAIGVVIWMLFLGILSPPLFLIPLFALAGYGIGKIIAKKEEHEQKINDYKTKIEQWIEEGYEVSEFKERWLK